MTSDISHSDPTHRAVMLINWLLSPLNLPKDACLKNHMDEDLYLDMDILLQQNECQNLGPIDTNQLAHMLQKRSLVVQVDISSHKLRPIWATRSLLVIENVPNHADVYDIMYIFGLKLPSCTMWSPDACRILPCLPLPLKLSALAKIASTVWVGVFDNVLGATQAMEHVTGKLLYGAQIQPYVYEECSWQCWECPRNIYPLWEVLCRYTGVDGSELKAFASRLRNNGALLPGCSAPNEDMGGNVLVGFSAKGGSRSCTGVPSSPFSVTNGAWLHLDLREGAIISKWSWPFWCCWRLPCGHILDYDHFQVESIGKPKCRLKQKNFVAQNTQQCDLLESNNKLWRPEQKNNKPFASFSRARKIFLICTSYGHKKVVEAVLFSKSPSNTMSSA